MPANTPTSHVCSKLGFAGRDVVELNASAWCDGDCASFAAELMRAFGVGLTLAQEQALHALRLTRPHEVQALALQDLLSNLRMAARRFCNGALLILVRRVSPRWARMRRGNRRAAAWPQPRTPPPRASLARPRAHALVRAAAAHARRPTRAPRARSCARRALTLVAMLVDTIELAWGDELALQPESSGCICVALDGCEPGIVQTLRPDGTVSSHTIFALGTDI